MIQGNGIIDDHTQGHEGIYRWDPKHVAYCYLLMSGQFPPHYEIQLI